MKHENASHQETVLDTTAASVSSRAAHETGRQWSWQLVTYTIIICLSMTLYGYDNAFVAPLLAIPMFITKYQGPDSSFTARNLNLIVSVPLVGAALGAFLATPLLKRFGRKKALLVAYFLLSTPGSCLQLFAPNLGALVAGRFWNYLGISVLTTAAPLYLAEIVPPHFRGRAIGFSISCTFAVGVLATTVVWATRQLPDNRSYQIPLAIQAGCPALFGFLTLVVPESPLWQLQHNNVQPARCTLMALRNGKSEIVDAEVSSYQSLLAIEAQNRANIKFWDILAPSNLKRTLTAGALLCLNQVSGLILVSTYSTVVLAQSGVADPFETTIFITCLQFLGTLIGPTLVDKVGRRPVALVGFCVLFVLDIIAGSLGTTGLRTDGQAKALAAVFITFGFFNSASFQSLAYVLPTEIAAPSLREPTMTWAFLWSYVTAIITTFAIPQLTSPDAADLGTRTAYIFACCVAITILWSYFFIPETKGRTAADIDRLYSINLPMRRWRTYERSDPAATA